MELAGILVAISLVGPGPLDDPAPASATQAERDFFEARIRPVLVEHCLSCHGDKKQEMGLRLDSAAALKRGSEAGPVLVAGDPDNSPLIEAVRHSGPTRMPPKDKLPPNAIADLEQWVKQGAYWPDSPDPSTSASDPREHWAFQPVKAPPIPVPASVDQSAATAVDAFIHRELRSHGLTPAPRADRQTLIRRLSFDLVGLPPSPSEVEAFVSDPRPDEIAWAALVDRLLADPRYGERWGRHWLDVARYADTKGYVFLEESRYPWAYAYRDYVVRAFNEDLAYDQFVMQQIAADRLVSGDDRRPLAALGFITVGGRFMNNQHDILDDRIDVVTRGLMGLTVTCARCHDHKYDPISQKDYYALYGVFASSVEPTVAPLFEPEPETDEYRAYAAEMATREAKLAEFVRVKNEELVRSVHRRVADYLLFVHKHRDQPPTEEFMQIADGADLNPAVIARWRAFFDRARRQHNPVFALWFALEDIPADRFVQEAPAVIDRVLGDANNPVNALVAEAFRKSPPSSLEDAARIYGDLLWANEWVAADFARRAELEGRDVSLADPAREQLRRVFHGRRAPGAIELKVEGDIQLLPDRESQETFKKLLGAVEEWRFSGPGAPPRAMALVDSTRPVEPHVFLRGNPNRPGPAVPRRFIEVLAGENPPPFQEGSGRLDLARAITDPKNPLTSRVFVNRIWMHHFGAPLVKTPSDFGLRSDPPSHPELLDWLAAAFVADGWSIKALQRRILLSHAYQQSSENRADAAAVDPENRLLARFNRRRLDFEAMRDALLSVSGTLDQRIGGPSIPSLADVATPRRTLYGHIDRLNLPGVFRTFDFPDPTVSNPMRDETSVPPQALFLMNHPMVAQLAGQLAARAEIRAAGDDGTRVASLYRLCFGRAPSVDESAAAVEFVRNDPDPAAAWNHLAHALLLSNEFLFVD